MNKTASIILTFTLAVVLGIIFISNPKSNNIEDKVSNQAVKSTMTTDGVQYITINAKGGYSPSVSTAQANIPTKLIIRTDKTYDCSSSLVIHQIGYKNILPQTGETEIDIGAQKAGEILRGVCGMGMYSFQIKFI